ncbi:MAG TPA: M17 family peptidase N-terminal domain-containing protein, partial [Steroidobacteraceae bacterium]|nr:M17 family peptidase N-terminal domain-containing protein [Steroidobacteraceae bacterium]
MIRLDSQHGRLAGLAADCLAVGLFDDNQFTDAARQLDTASKGQLRRLRESGDLPSRPGDSLLLLQLAGVRARRILVIGLGKRADFNRRGWRKCVAAALAACIKGKSAHLALAIERPAV